MKEVTRTIVLVLLIVVMAGYMYWVTHQSDESLQGAQPGRHAGSAVIERTAA